jgi:hypothetical protein
MNRRYSLFCTLLIAGLSLYSMLVSAQEPSSSPGKQPTETTQTGTESKEKSAVQIEQAAPKPPQAADQETKGKEPDKSGVTETPSKPGGVEKKGKEDRRWITRTRPDEKKPMPKKDLPPLNWANEDQKKKCDALLEPLKESYTKARYYSIRGDSCSTAEHSKTFLTHVDTCKKDCPKDFLERAGYDETLITNVRYLQKAGTERCVGAQQQKKSVPKSAPAPKN